LFNGNLELSEVMGLAPNHAILIVKPMELAIPDFRELHFRAKKTCPFSDDPTKTIENK